MTAQTDPQPTANILVRAYEDRADLLRCLIIGPLGTPFQNAPFLFDVFLSPTKFPHEPPNVFFHSWAGGTRVSPNLYAEGASPLVPHFSTNPMERCAGLN